MIISIHQPNYIPWIGYFEKIFLSDIFIFFDNVQMPKNKSFVSRSKLVNQNNAFWLTIPIKKEGLKTIAEAEIVNNFWKKKHLSTIHHAYSKSSFYNNNFNKFSKILLSSDTGYIAELNIKIINLLLEILDIKAKVFRASELNLKTSGASSIYEIIKIFGADTYLSGDGIGSLKHMDYQKLEKLNINLKFVNTDLKNYYSQYKNGDNIFSILDLLLTHGDSYIKEKLNYLI